MFKKAMVLMVLTLAVAAGCTRGEQKGKTALAPDFTLQDLSGGNVRLSDLKGKVVLVEFWATWCPPCRASIPSVEHLHQTYAQKGLVVLGVSLDEEWDSVRSFAQKNGISFPVLRGTEDVSSKYSVRVIPTVFLVNKEGLIAKKYIGGEDEETIEKDLRSML